MSSDGLSVFELEYPWNLLEIPTYISVFVVIITRIVTMFMKKDSVTQVQLSVKLNISGCGEVPTFGGSKICRMKKRNIFHSDRLKWEHVYSIVYHWNRNLLSPLRLKDIQKEKNNKNPWFTPLFITIIAILAPGATSLAKNYAPTRHPSLVLFSFAHLSIASIDILY